MRIVNQNLLFGPFNPDLGLFNGRMGIVLFFFHYAKYTNNALYEDFAGDMLDDIFEDVTDETPINMQNGLCGIGWGLLYLIQKGFVEGNVDEILEDIDRKIEMDHVQNRDEIDHYQRFRSAQTYDYNAYSSSEIIHMITNNTNINELSWQHGLNIIYNETAIYNK